MKKFLSFLSISLLIAIGAQIVSADIYNPPATVSTPVSIANGGTNNTSFLAPASGINAIPWFNGTSLVTNTSVLDLGYSSTTDTIYTNQIKIASPQTTVATFTNTTNSQSALGGAGMIGYANPGTAMLNGSRLGFYLFGGTTDAASTTINSSGMQGMATENWSATNQGSDVEIVTTPNATTTAARRVVATFDNNGSFTANVGTSTLATTTVQGNFNTTGTYIPRVVAYNNASTTINIATTDIASTTIATATTFVNPVGTPVDGQMFEVWGVATSTQNIFYGTNFASSTDLSNVSSVATGTTKWIYEYRASSGKWELNGLLKTY